VDLAKKALIVGAASVATIIADQRLRRGAASHGRCIPIVSCKKPR
jgi:hypothetical protein